MDHVLRVVHGRPDSPCSEWTLVFRFGHSRQTPLAQALGYPLTKLVVSFRNM